MAKEELQKRGVEVVLIPEDTQLLPRVAATAAQKLISRDRVNVVVSLWDTAEAVAPIAEQRKTPHISIRWNHRVAQEFPHTFTFESTYVTWVRATLNFLRSKGVKRLAVMTDESAAGWVFGREYLLQVAAEYGINIVTDVQFLGAAGDINLSLTKLLAEPSDYMLMLHFGPSLVETMRRLAERKVSTPVTGYFDGMEPPVNIEGRPFVAQFDTQAWFLDRFSARFPGERPTRAAFGYDLVLILGELVTRLKRTPSADEIIGHLNALRGYAGATGVISANDSRTIETTCVLKGMHNGVAVRIGDADSKHVETTAATASESCAARFCVGMNLPLSGPVGEYGSAIRNGVAMAQDESPEHFKGIKFVYEDSQYKPAKSVSAFKKLAHVDRVSLVYTFGGSVSEVVAPIGQQLKIPTLISSIDPQAKVGRSFVLRFDNPKGDFGAGLLSQLRRISARRIGLVVTENHYLNALVDGLRSSLGATESLEIQRTFQADDLDFKSTIAALRRDPPDALGVFLLPGQVSAFFREMRIQQFKLPVFGSDVFDSLSEIRAAQGAMDGAFLAHHITSPSFRSTYVQRYGNDFQIAYASQGYDLANLVASLFANHQGRIPAAEEVLSRLRASGRRRGMSGDFEFTSSPDGDEFFRFPIVVKRIRGDEVVVD